MSILVLAITILMVIRFEFEIEFFQSTVDVFPAEGLLIVPLTFAGFLISNLILSTFISFFTRPHEQPEINLMEDFSLLLRYLLSKTSFTSFLSGLEAEAVCVGRHFRSLFLLCRECRNYRNHITGSGKAGADYIGDPSNPFCMKDLVTLVSLDRNLLNIRILVKLPTCLKHVISGLW